MEKVVVGVTDGVHVNLVTVVGCCRGCGSGSCGGCSFDGRTWRPWTRRKIWILGSTDTPHAQVILIAMSEEVALCVVVGEPLAGGVQPALGLTQAHSLRE